VTDGTKRTYRSTFTVQIGPAIGHKPIGKVTRDDVRTLLETMPRQVGPASVMTARTLLVAMFGEALKSRSALSWLLACRSSR
jgi:hypothetical protein